VPSLALINHIADGGEGDVSQKSLLRALAFAGYLESHARRVYGSGSEGETSAANAILKHIRAGDLPEGFTSRDILRHGWAHLTDREQIAAGLNLLVEFDYLVPMETAAGSQGGRPKTTYTIHPEVLG
jgi:putative DNA primase/helicase